MTQIETRALVFDMDGLLIDSEPLWWEVEQDLARSEGITWTDAQASACTGGGLENVIRQMQALGMTTAVGAGVEALVTGFVARVTELRLKPGVTELLDASEGMPRALATSSTRRLAEAVLQRFDLRRRFDATVTASDVEHTKPAPDIFLRACGALGLADGSRDGVVVLEDSLNGVRAACAAELTVIAVPERWDGDWPERYAALTPHVVRDLHEVRRMLRLMR